MCDTCGCNITPAHRHSDGASVRETVAVLEDLLAANDRQAEHNRSHFAEHGVFAVNLMSSPGAGKTSLLEATADLLADGVRIGVIEGDLQTENDAERIRKHGLPVVQITTGTACHLDASMVHRALHGLDLKNLDVLFIENVGNLVCPASFDLGQHRNVVLLSTPEGDDKPAKYPVMFRTADLVVLSKRDLGPVMPEFSISRAVTCVRELGNGASVVPVSAKSGQGMSTWGMWLLEEMHTVNTRGGRGAVLEPGGDKRTTDTEPSS